MIPVTVFGAEGFIGRSLVARLRAEGRPVNAITRTNLPVFLATQPAAGDIIYCLGLTADFRSRPLDTAEAHVSLVGRLLGTAHLRSFLYLSSTRVYARCETAREDIAIPVQPNAPSDIYNITKLAGEAICLSDPRNTVRVARLSNVFGAGMHRESFLGQILTEGATSGAVTLRQSLRSAKDYISITDVVTALVSIARSGDARLYNVASGVNTTHDAIASVLGLKLDWQITARENATTVRFPRIDIERLTIEFAAPRNTILDELPQLAPSFALEPAC
jgi:nucleoside-diphosphate-sugar epimerase